MRAAQLEPEVLVVGAGPVGLTAAAELTRHGVRVRIVDKRTGPVGHSQAAAVHVRTQEVFRAMGIVDGWLKAGHRLERVSVRAFGRRLGVLYPGGVDSPHPTPLVVGQDITEQLLVRHLEKLGVKVQRNVEATEFSQDADSVRVTLHHLAEQGREDVMQVPWLVDCEGSASKAREATGIAFEGERYAGHEFLMADAQVDWSFPHGALYMFIEKDTTVVCFPFDDLGRYRLICAREDQDPACTNPPSLEEIEDLARSVLNDGQLHLSQPRWLTRFRSQHRLAERFRHGRIFLAGDAGHVHVPIGGQGMNYGIQDAFNLAWKLAAVIRGDARPEPLLDSYNAERHPAAQALIHGTDEGFHAFVHPTALTQFGMKMLGPLALGWELVQDRIRTSLSEVSVAYLDSAIVEDRRVRSGPRPGERAPDALTVRMPEQRTIHLIDLFCEPRHWTLLLFAGENSPQPAEDLAALARMALEHYEFLLRAYLVLLAPEFISGGSANHFTVLVDRELSVHEKYGAEAPCLYLVRPDGHVGFRGTLDNLGDLITYLGRIGFGAKPGTTPES